MTPERTPDWFKEYFWLGFIEFASREKTLILEFENESGEFLIPAPKNAMEAMIDKATSANQHNIGVMKKFVIWVTENYWGEEDAPEIYFQKFKEAQ